MKKFIPNGAIRVPPTGKKGVVGQAKKIDRMRKQRFTPSVVKGRKVS
jgi:hypothetical protein